MTDILNLWFGVAIVLLTDLLVAVVKATFSHARLPHLLNLREHRQSAVDQTVNLLEKPLLQLSLRVAETICHLFLGGVLMVLIATYNGYQTLWLSFLYLLFAFVLLNLLEFALIGWILQEPEENAIRFRYSGSLIYFIFLPLSTLLKGLIGAPVDRVTLASMTEEDLKKWVEAGQAEGSLEKGEREMIYSIFQFGDTLAKEIMVPRIDLISIDIHATLGEARVLFESAGHSRLPVYEDTVDNIVGLLYAKDLLNIQKDDEAIIDHRELLRLAYFVPEAKKVDELLAEMQGRSMHMAIVVDEYGGVAGVVTLEDIVEEIVGEIRDEYDESEEMPYVQVGEGEFIFQGRVDLGIFNDVMKSHISNENADTIGGFIYGEIGDVPTGGEIVRADDVTLIVDQVDGRRITKVRARRESRSSILKGDDNAER